MKYTFSVIRHRPHNDRERGRGDTRQKVQVPCWVRYYSVVSEEKCVLVAIYRDGRAVIDNVDHTGFLGKDQRCSKRRFENAFKMALRRIQSGNFPIPNKTN